MDSHSSLQCSSMKFLRRQSMPTKPSGSALAPPRRADMWLGAHQIMKQAAIWKISNRKCVPLQHLFGHFRPSVGGALDIAGARGTPGICCIIIICGQAIRAKLPPTGLRSRRHLHLRRRHRRRRRRRQTTTRSVLRPTTRSSTPVDLYLKVAREWAAQRSTGKSLGNRGDGAALTSASLAAVLCHRNSILSAVKFAVRSISIAV